MNQFIRKASLRANYEIKKRTRKPFARYLNPFKDTNQRTVLIHCCYHKVGTVWFGRILREVAAHFGLSCSRGYDYTQISRFEEKKDSDIFLDLGSHVELSRLENYRGSHMIRDPRDLVVSAYFYHLWTDEPWANFPRAEYRGRSYKEYLNSLDFDEGLSKEIERESFWITHMASWNYQNPRIYEIRYEEMILDEQRHFAEMFRHYGFRDAAVKKSCQIAEKYSFRNMTGGKTGSSQRKSHLRSGKSGEWRQYFKPAHSRLFKRLYPEVVVKLGYEADDNW